VKNLINKAIAILESTVPKLTIGFRLLVYFPPLKQYRLSTVSNIEGNKVIVSFDMGGTAPYLTTSENIIGKGTSDIIKEPIREEQVGQFIKSFFSKPKPSFLLEKKQLKEPVKEGNKNKFIINPIYDCLKNNSSRLSESDHSIPYIYRNKVGGEIKKSVSMDQLLSELRKIPNIVIHLPSRASSNYLIPDQFSKGMIGIIPPDEKYNLPVWYYN
jgi:hypothetical protein